MYNPCKNPFDSILTIRDPSPLFREPERTFAMACEKLYWFWGNSTVVWVPSKKLLPPPNKVWRTHHVGTKSSECHPPNSNAKKAHLVKPPNRGMLHSHFSTRVICFFPVRYWLEWARNFTTHWNVSKKGVSLMFGAHKKISVETHLFCCFNCFIISLACSYNN